MAFVSCIADWPRADAPTPEELPLRLKDKVVPLPVEGFGKATALDTESAAAAALGSWPQTRLPDKYPVACASSRKLLLASKLQSLAWLMLLQSLLLNRLCTWRACPGWRTIFPVKV